MPDNSDNNNKSNNKKIKNKEFKNNNNEVGKNYGIIIIRQMKIKSI